MAAPLSCICTCSPVSDGGRGLKQPGRAASYEQDAFARQRWRAWIETRCWPVMALDGGVRPSAMAGVD